MYAPYTNRPVPGCSTLQRAQIADVSVVHSHFREAAYHTLYVPQTIVNVILKGEKRMYDGRTVHHLRAGDVLLIPRDSLLCSEILPGGFESLNLQVPDALLAGILADAPVASAPQKTVSLQLKMSASWQAYTDQLLHCTLGHSSMDHTSLSHQLQTLLLQQADVARVLGVLQAAREDVLAAAIRAVSDATEPIKQLDALTGKSYMSRASLQRHFQQRYQSSPMAWLREQRLSRAGFLLRTTGMAIKEIAYSSGFEDITHFYRLFQKQYGVTPAAWRATA